MVPESSSPSLTILSRATPSWEFVFALLTFDFIVHSVSIVIFLYIVFGCLPSILITLVHPPLHCSTFSWALIPPHVVVEKVLGVSVAVVFYIVCG